MSLANAVSSQLSIFILTKNESIHIQRCLKNIDALGVKAFVVDSNSTDGTDAIATAMGATVFQCSESRFADKLNWTLANVPFHSEWVMRLDADETLSQEMIKALSKTLTSLPSEVSGLLVRRQLWFMGKRMRHGGIYPSWSMRIWRKGIATCESRDLDEHMLLIQGSALTIPLDIIDNPLTDLSAWIEKHNRYATIEARAYLKENNENLLQPRFFGNSLERVRWIKLKIFYQTPPFIRSLLYFIYRYILRLGFLDGRVGFIFHLLHSFWYRFLIDAKIFENVHSSTKRNALE